jgi:hypothetical protein
MSDAELVIVLCGAAVLIVASFLGARRRKRLNSVDYWQPDGTRLKRLKRKADRPKPVDNGCGRNAIGPALRR